MEQFISMFIDNELSLEEKEIFLKLFRDNEEYARNTKNLLAQEKILHAAFKHQISSQLPASCKKERKYLSWGLSLAACLLMVFSFLLGSRGFNREVAFHEESAAIPHRFVIHSQGSSSVEIAGSFTGWHRVSLSPSGFDDYWEVTLPLTRGEHRYLFIIDAKKLLPDPTVIARESDDFGATNSILRVGISS